MKKKILWFAYLFALTFVFVACGSGGGGSSGNSNNNNGNNGGGIPDLPPDPGSAGKATLEGIDSNKNGVRDDVEIAIYNYAPKPEQERLRAALTQDAIATQLAIIAGHTKDPQKINEASEAISRSSSCYIVEMNHFGLTEQEFMNLGTYITKKAVNTPNRVEAYMRFNEALNGRFFEDDDELIPCDSDKEKEQKAQAAFNAKPFNVQSAYNLPPDPGSEGKKTLEGIDSNNNGIRDDVEIAIYNYAPKGNQEELRQAMMQQAKAALAIMKLDLSNSNSVLEAFHESNRATKCIKQKTIRTDFYEYTVIDRAGFNTPQRNAISKAYWDAVGKILRKNNMNPLSIVSDDPVPCDYDKAKR